MMIRRSRALALSVMVPVLVLAYACADLGTPTQPLAPGAATHVESGTLHLGALATFTESRQLASSSTSKVIGSAGGRVELGGFAVVVPAGAVSKPTTFSIQLPTDPLAAERVVAEFGPHGAQFSKPVRIEFPLAGTSLEGVSGATVVWWNGAEWVDMGGQPTTDGGRLWTTTDHFSEFGTTEERGGSVTVSGG